MKAYDQAIGGVSALYCFSDVTLLDERQEGHLNH